MRKTPVRWTDRESCQVALEVERIKQNPEAHENRAGNGTIPKTLASMVNLAQRVLPNDRRRSGGAAFTQKDLAGWFKHHLAQRSTFFPAPPPAAEKKVEPPPVDPARTLVDHLVGLISNAVEQGVGRALAHFHEVQEQGHGIALARHRANGGVEQRDRTILDEMVTKRHAIDVVGLRGGQVDVVRRDEAAQGFDIRFINSDSPMEQKHLRHEVILCTKFIAHSMQNRYRSMQGTKIHYANGGPHSVIEQLKTIAAATPKPH